MAGFVHGSGANVAVLTVGKPLKTRLLYTVKDDGYRKHGDLPRLLGEVLLIKGEKGRKGVFSSDTISIRLLADIRFKDAHQDGELMRQIEAQHGRRVMIQSQHPWGLLKESCYAISYTTGFPVESLDMNVGMKIAAAVAEVNVIIARIHKQGIIKRIRGKAEPPPKVELVEAVENKPLAEPPAA